MGNESVVVGSDDGPPYFYVRDKGMAAAHHWDYIHDRADEALCGHGYLDPVTLGCVPRPRRVCRACQDRLPEYHAAWWAKRADELDSELRTVCARLQTARSDLSALRNKFDDLRKHSDNQRKTLSALQKKQGEINRTKRAGSIVQPVVIDRRPTSSRLDESDEIAGVSTVETGPKDSVVAAGIAEIKATDALRKLCRARSGAISHNDVIEALDRVMKSLDRAERVMLKAEFRKYGSGLEWARSELAAMGRRMT